MIYHGHVENGHVVLDGPAALPEGAAVTVELRPATEAETGKPSPSKEFRVELMKFAGIAKNLPEDAARNLDHCLYGHPKQ